MSDLKKRNGKNPIDEIEDLDDLEFISQESVRDMSKMADGDVIKDKMVSEKKTRRRGADAEEAKKERKRNVARKFLPLIIIIIIAAVVAAGYFLSHMKGWKEKRAQENKEQPVSAQEYEKDQYEQINELITNYYDCYADGETEKILQYAYPMSDSEKSYIQMYSAFLDEYQNIVCYTKTGADEDSYIVSVAFDVKYKDAQAAAPGMDFFYVRSNSDGSVYIDNVYSPFNLLYQEYPLDQGIVSLITDYESGEDVIALQAGVQTKYEQTLSQNEDLSNLVNVTIADAVSAWNAEHEAEIQQKAAEAAAQVQQETAAEETADTEETAAEEVSQAPESAEPEVNADETEQKAWVYTNDSINIRKEPDETSEILTSVRNGAELRQLAVTSNGWSKVKTGEIVGYAKSEYLSAEKTSSEAAALDEGKKIELTVSVNVRRSMSESSEKVGLAYKGDIVKVIQSYSEGWTKVEWNGKTGYIRTDILIGM